MKPTYSHRIEIVTEKILQIQIYAPSLASLNGAISRIQTRTGLDLTLSSSQSTQLQPSITIVKTPLLLSFSLKCLALNICR